jgi:hypothetical protein
MDVLERRPQGGFSLDRAARVLFAAQRLELSSRMNRDSIELEARDIRPRAKASSVLWWPKPAAARASRSALPRC